MAARAHGAVAVVGQHHGARVAVARGFGVQAIEHAEAAAGAQLEVDDGEIRAVALELGERTRLVVGVGHHLHTVELVEQLAQHVAQDRRVLNQHHAQRRPGRCAHARLRPHSRISPWRRA